MYIQLEQKDYDLIAEVIAEVEDTYNGYIEYGDLCIEVRFSKEIQWHKEDDYHNGTGACIVDNVRFGLESISLGDVEVKYDTYKLIKTVENCLKGV